MNYRASVLSAFAGVAILACGGQRGALEQNKALVRDFFADVDSSGESLAFIERWMAPGFQTYINSPTPVDVNGYREFMTSAVAAFSDLRHEIKYLVAEGDRVAAGITLRMVHRGEFLGIPATGRTVAVEEIVVLELLDGKISREWVLFDLASLQQQLTAPVAASS